MHLLIDQGNSRCKYLLTKDVSDIKVVDRGSWLNHDFDESHWLQQLGQLRDSYYEEHSIQQIIVSSVASRARKQWFAQLCLQQFGIEPIFAVATAEQANIGHGRLINSYDTPQALGIDRWLAMMAAYAHAQRGISRKEVSENQQQHPEMSFCVIDAGTAITLDVVSEQGLHLGGHIVPSFGLLQRTLLGKTESIAWSAGHDMTTNVGQSRELELGQNTSAAVTIGAKTMVNAYIQQALASLNRANHRLTLFVTGGDNQQVLEVIKKDLAINHDSIDVHIYPDLVFEGLGLWFSLNN